MAVDYATLKKGGFMRQKQKNNFSLRLRVVGGNLTAVQLAAIAEVAEKFGGRPCAPDFPAERGNPVCKAGSD